MDIVAITGKCGNKTLLRQKRVMYCNVLLYSDNVDEPESMEEDEEKDSDDEDEEEEDEEEDEESHRKKDELTARPRGCIVTEGSIHSGYTVLMTKVDVSFGAWGMYNFYRMQVKNSTSKKKCSIIFINLGTVYLLALSFEIVEVSKKAECQY